MGGLSLMSVTVMMAVAVLERPKFRLPSMSVACTMMVYWETFCGEADTQWGIYSSVHSLIHSSAGRRTPERNEKARLTPASQPPPVSSFETSSEGHDYDRLKPGVSSLPEEKTPSVRQR